MKNSCQKWLWMSILFSKVLWPQTEESQQEIKDKI